MSKHCQTCSRCEHCGKVRGYNPILDAPKDSCGCCVDCKDKVSLEAVKDIK